ncbi:MAG: GSCFA domain-containing protein, partial [Calditrichaeota bacterium]|nr:GSCFA domain-containing protein [Calditrichota bacterium]
MLKLRTELAVDPASKKIKRDSSILLIGSCFSDHIYERLNRYKFKVANKPNGTIYNPVSIADSLHRLVDKRMVSETDVFEHNGIWQSFDFHSDFSSLNRDLAIEKINQSINFHSDFLRIADHVFLTFGSSFIYRHKKTDTIVANCHQVAAKEFNHSILSFAETNKAIEKSIQLIRSANPDCLISVTVSPVRYLGNGFAANQLSKSQLITACNQVISNQKLTHYFPAYELVMDDLRDYRFYGDDLVHPNQLAIHYVWQKFCEAYMETDELKLLDKIDQVQRAINHRPRHPDSQAYNK